MRGLLAAGLGLALAVVGQARAQQLAITGQVRHPVAYGLDELRRLPGATVQWTARTGKGEQTAFYEGPLLWDLVRAAEPIDAPGAGAAGRSHLQHVIIARGHDGYAVAIAMGEIDPEFEGKKVLVSLPRPGQATLQLAVPNDSRAGRGVHDLAELEVR